MTKRIILLLLIGFSFLTTTAQNPRYLVKFVDKKLENNPYSLDNPEAFLSEKALERRRTQNIPIDTLDLPIFKGYLDSLHKAGIKIQNRSKWMNSVVAEADTTQRKLIEDFAFVKSVQFLAPARQLAKNTTQKGTQSEQSKHLLTYGNQSDTIDYGFSANQIKMLNGHILHQKGYRGQGKTIAVIDGGFSRVDNLPAFDSLWANNQILGVRDFEDNDQDVFNDHPHGTYVLSILAGNIPGFLYGSAPKADYWLLRSEVTSSEYIVEEYNWIAAAEFADSVGADVINTSLGYSEFNDQAQNHTYQDMDGNTTPVTRAADIASSRGMLVVISAGNLGDDQWHYISAPGDADSVLTVGAVDSFGSYASFSSTGPTADGRVKPDVVAQGQGAVFQYTDSSIIGGNGTSFSAPIITGLATCLWQKLSTLNNMELMNTIRQNANQYNNPDSLIGYGIPDFGKASGMDYPTLIDEYFAEKIPKVYPNPFKDSFSIVIPSEVSIQSPIQIEIYNIVGKKVLSKQLEPSIAGSPVKINEISDESAGFYFIEIMYDKNSVIRKKIIKSD